MSGLTYAQYLIKVYVPLMNRTDKHVCVRAAYDIEVILNHIGGILIMSAFDIIQFHSN